MTTPEPDEASSVSIANRGARPRTLARSLGVGLAAALATAMQVLWASPAAPSADGSASPLPYLAWLCLFAMLMTVAGHALLARRCGPGLQTTYLVAALAACWLLLDYHEVAMRVGAWSTFDAAALWLHAMNAAALPVMVCGAAFALATRRLLRPAGATLP